MSHQQPEKFYRRIRFITFLKIGLPLFILFILWKFNSNIKPNDKITDIGKPAVVVVIEKESQEENYVLAQSTLACYCKIYGYKLINIIMDRSPEMQKMCPQKHVILKK